MCMCAHARACIYVIDYVNCTQKNLNRKHHVAYTSLQQFLFSRTYVPINNNIKYILQFMKQFIKTIGTLWLFQIQGNCST